MKSFRIYLSGLLTILAMAITGCSDDFDTPPVYTPTADFNEQYLMSIADFKGKCWQDGNSFIDTIRATAEMPHLDVEGRVVSSDEAGNIYKSLVIQDETAALAMSINQNNMYNTYRIGQEIVIDLIDMYVGKYAGLMQLGEPQLYQNREWQATFMSYEFFQQHAQINGMPDASKIDTLDITIPSLPTDPAGICKMQSQLVRFTNVQWKEPGQVYAEDQTSVSRNIVDESGNSLVVRNSGYATFRSNLIPAGEGNVVGVLSYFNNAWQLLLRSEYDVYGFHPVSTEGKKEDPYTVARAIELQDGGVTGWVKGYIVGAVAPGVTTVSSNDNIEWKADVVLDNTIVIAASADVKDYTKCLVVELPSGSDLRKAANLLDNPGAYQKEISVRGNLVKSLGMAGVKCPGSSSDFVLEGVTPPSPAAGDGSETNPFTVAQVQNGSATGTAWVTGYIVGWIDGMTFNEAGTKFTAPATSKTNIIIAATADEKDYSKCVPVQLPAGDVRNSLNLQDNAGNLGKVVAVNGSIEKYFGVTGVKTVTAFKLDGEGSGGGSTDPQPSGDAVFSNSLLGDEAGFTIQDKTKPEGLSYVWANTTNYGWKASAFVNSTNYATESWLISPAITLPPQNTTLTFDHARKFGDNSHLGVYISTDKTNWTALSVPNWPDGSSWDYISSGAISLSAYNGKTIYVAFTYTSTPSAAATREIKNFLIAK